MATAAPAVVVLQVAPEWAALLSRLQQVKGQPGAELVLVDLDNMTLWVLGPPETLPRPRAVGPSALYTKPDR